MRANGWSLIVMLGVLLPLGGCGAPAARDGELAHSELISVVSTGRGAARTLRIDAAPGARINALLPPVLTTDLTERFAFHQDSLTADSAYFAVSPSVLIGDSNAREGMLQASVCPADVRVCLSVDLPVRLR